MMDLRNMRVMGMEKPIEAKKRGWRMEVTAGW
jgi:hypothetical protein